MFFLSSEVEVPIIVRTEYLVIDIDEKENVTLDDGEGGAKCGLRLPNLCESDFALASKIRSAMDEGTQVYVTVVTAMNKEAIKDFNIGSGPD